CPAGTHRGQQGGLVDDAEEAFELAGEVAAGTVLDQRRGADRAGLAAGGALRAPRREERRQDRGRDRLLVELEPDLDREAALLSRIGGGANVGSFSPLAPRASI